MFAIAFDGFIQTARYATLEEAKKQWEKDIKNRFLYEYDCSVYELSSEGKVVRVVGFNELKENNGTH
jgi:hypothetical protein